MENENVETQKALFIVGFLIRTLLTPKSNCNIQEQISIKIIIRNRYLSHLLFSLYFMLFIYVLQPTKQVVGHFLHSVVLKCTSNGVKLQHLQHSKVLENSVK